MADLYSHIFCDIFNNCVPFFMHDFLNIRCTGEGNKKYCLFTYKKIFEETIKVLDKSRYNGEIVMPKNIAFDSNNIYSVDEIIKTSKCFIKNNIIVNSDNIIKLKNSRETPKKERIFLLPIDGIRSFLNGNSDFSMVLILQEKNKKNDNVFDVKSISVFNPIRKDIFTFDEIDGCKYNGKKISFDDFYKDAYVDMIFVNNMKQKNVFDLTKLFQISEGLSISDSIFSSLVALLTTGKNFCISKIDEDFTPFIEFMTKKSLLSMVKIGAYVAIGKESIINKVIDRK